MIRLIDLETDEDFTVFREILEKVNKGQIVATLKQIITKSDGSYSYMDIQQEIASVGSIFQVNGKYAYVTIPQISKADRVKFSKLYDVMLRRGTNQFSHGNENNYLLAIDLVQEEIEKTGYVYIISAVQPFFMTSEGNDDLTFVFDLEDVCCTKDNITPSEVEYEQLVRDEMEDEVHNFRRNDEDENENNTQLEKNFDDNGLISIEDFSNTL